MFMIPAAHLIMQNESMLYAPEDLILALDRWILPKYPNLTTQNPAITKVECMGILHAFHTAGKMHMRFKAAEITKAVDAFLEDRLWVERKTLDALQLLPNQRPEFWMTQPSLFKVLRIIPRVMWEASVTIWNLLSMSGVYTFYRFTREREFSVPKSPTERKAATVTLIKKDS